MVWGASSLELSRVSSMRPIDFGPEQTGKTLAGDIRRGVIGACVQRGREPNEDAGTRDNAREGPKVCRLPAGAKRIRTAGPPFKKNTTNIVPLSERFS